MTGEGAAHLADLLQNRHDEAQVADVKRWQGQSDMTEVAIAILEGVLTSGTFSNLARGTL